MEPLSIIERVTAKIAPGRSPSFTESNVVKALELIEGQVIGRTKLSRELQLGEGTTRTLIKHLKKEGIIQVSRRGIVLSDHGKKIVSGLKLNLSIGIEIPFSPITVAPYNIAVLVRGVAHKVNIGLEERDYAIKAGANGATTLVFSKNRLTMPSSNQDILRNLPSIHAKLISELHPKENDVIIIGSAETKMNAELGARTAALELLRSAKKKASKHENAE
ncbi:MAG: hypothetical protein JSV64_07465 [Candidatus Bathyarchaeota archaeon]|jgi:predicted transcriptional regulator|nr:MAG: hypothetical protein JSV64_07465 [Candidatus Bathyarchaeota archaeon]